MGGYSSQHSVRAWTDLPRELGGEWTLRGCHKVVTVDDDGSGRNAPTNQLSCKSKTLASGLRTISG